MKQPAPVSTFVALALAVSASLALVPGCGGDAKPGETGGSGAAGGGETTTGGAGGATTTTETENAQCKALCEHLDDIQCSVLQNCAQDCPNHLNAPPDCVDEADALIACWAAHVDDFKCTPQGALPPLACSAEETAFNKCVGGDQPTASCLCSAGVGVGDNENSCSRKTTCGAQQFNQTCQKTTDGEPWSCTCLSNGGLLGTCTEPPEFQHCSNDFGCCVPLFCAASSE